jgi:purine-binding chemotaxis protein CheW
MNKQVGLVTFEIEQQHFAVLLGNVKRVINVVELTPLPEAPEVICGIINYEGRIIPVANLRLRFGMPGRSIELSDRIIIAATPNRIVGLLVDSVTNVIQIEEKDISQAGEVLPGLVRIIGIGKVGSEMILITDLAKFLSLEEENKLNNAMTKT